jgi:hypothetical protein
MFHARRRTARLPVLNEKNISVQFLEETCSMPKFLFVYRGGDPDESKFSAEELQQIMQKWNDWIAAGFQQGYLVDPGDALLPDGKVVRPGKVVSDGPFAESKELVGGFTVVEAEDAAAAAEIAKGCPILLTGGTVEVRQMAGIAPSP